MLDPDVCTVCLKTQEKTKFTTKMDLFGSLWLLLKSTLFAIEVTVIAFKAKCCLKWVKVLEFDLCNESFPITCAVNYILNM